MPRVLEAVVNAAHAAPCACILLGGLNLFLSWPRFAILDEAASATVKNMALTSQSTRQSNLFNHPGGSACKSRMVIG